MQTLYYLLLEYALIVRQQARALWQCPPPQWQTGNKGDIVLIPGFGEPWTFLATLAHHLNGLGYKIHIVPKLDRTTAPVNNCVEVLHEYIQQKSLTNVTLLGHSKGGIVAKIYLDAYPENVHRVCSISAPYQGTRVGYLYFCGLKSLLPHSPLLKSLLGNAAHNAKVINLYARVDNHILPNINAILPGATNVELSIIGHTRILENPRTLETIQAYL